MNSRERVQRAIHFNQPDRAPVSHAVLPAAQLKYGAALDALLTEYREDFGWDYMTDLPVERFPAPYRLGRNADDFGTVWQSEMLGVCGIPVDWPIPSLARYAEYAWPADFTAGPPSGRQYSGHMCGFDERWYARGAWITYFEQLQQLCGMQNFLMDLATDAPNLERLMDDMLAFNLRWIGAWTRLEYDGLHFADDWGSQERLLIRPDVWRRLFKPRYAEMFRAVHAAGMDVWFHSDGKINAILPDLIEIGVDVINLQVRVVGYDWIAENARGRVAIRTDIDRQWVLPFGSPADVREDVRRTFAACGAPQGGLVACGEIGPDVPLENIRALYAAFREFGGG
ncbi:MAG: uroporphyrinogen decarboxylase family protein [Chloroflexota bacterium]